MANDETFLRAYACGRSFVAMKASITGGVTSRMDQKQRQWMSHEITRWRENRLLPERYCEFLARLYQLPEATIAPEKSGNIASEVGVSAWLNSLSAVKWMALFFISGLFCTAGFYFTAFDFPMQIGAVAAFIVLGYGLAVYKLKYAEKKSKLQAAICACLGNAAGILGSLAILILHEWMLWWSLALWLIGAGLLWLITGLLLRRSGIQGFGWLTLAIAYAIILDSIGGELTLIDMQWLWLPESLLFIWLAWVLHHRSHSASAALLLASVITWHMPEVAWLGRHIALKLNPGDEVLLFMLAKLFIMFYMGYYFRKKWVKWIREHQTVQTITMDRGLGA